MYSSSTAACGWDRAADPRVSLPAHRRGDFGPASAYATILIISIPIPPFILNRISGKDISADSEVQAAMTRLDFFFS